MSGKIIRQAYGQFHPIYEAITKIAEHVERAARDNATKHGPFASPHEAHSVILEELEELFDEVRKKRELRSALALRNEAIDIATAALRFAAQLELELHPVFVPTEERAEDFIK